MQTLETNELPHAHDSSPPVGVVKSQTPSCIRDIYLRTPALNLSVHTYLQHVPSAYLPRVHAYRHNSSCTYTCVLTGYTEWRRCCIKYVYKEKGRAGLTKHSSNKVHTKYAAPACALPRTSDAWPYSTAALPASERRHVGVCNIPKQKPLTRPSSHSPEKPHLINLRKRKNSLHTIYTLDLSTYTYTPAAVAVHTKQPTTQGDPRARPSDTRVYVAI